ncbi:hypothetical protein [Sulfurisphaera ohwakuensis]|uniref:hypothetical protein n=1 Tax=Sulfurisphaera ohwakuensis TaxID=69656 RepID=UPI001C84CCA0|nr:hypothetical protein [Sulfurisphaera ohwakuensis]
MIKIISHANVGYAQKGEGENSRDVSSVPLGSKEIRDLPTSRWLRVKSLDSIMIEMKV